MFAFQEITDENFHSLDYSDPENILADSYENCIFSTCHFQAADLDKIRFENCTFDQCNFSMANLLDSRFQYCIFKGGKFLATDWSRARELKEPKFSHCNMEGSVFNHLDIRYGEFKDCHLIATSFLEVKLQDAVFCHSDLQEAIFEQCQMERCDFRGAKDYQIDIQQNTIRGAQFSRDEAIGLLVGMGVLIE